MYLRRFLINCCVKAVLLLIRYYNLLLKKGKADGMKNILKEDLIYEILSVVAEIPLGKEMCIRDRVVTEDNLGAVQ